MEYHVSVHEICKYSSEHARIVSNSLTPHLHVSPQSSGKYSWDMQRQIRWDCVRYSVFALCTGWDKQGRVM